MTLTLYQVDAFTDTQFHGNPAAVCPLTAWLSDELLQAIAEENNLSETAFYVPQGDMFHIRWFTPICEVDLCGHATLATGHVLFRHEGYARPVITFTSRSGLLLVRKEGEELVLDFPVDKLNPVSAPAGLTEALGSPPLEVYRGKDDFMAIYGTEEEVASMRPDFTLVEKIPARGVIITAPGRTVDFVSRFFGPQSGIAEDPVTGSAHTTLVPYWSRRLGKTRLRATQVSKRRGELRCVLNGERVEIGGHACTYLIGTIALL
ncbi:MAG TPA: PhzF family phenazine biosynthesis protein [Bacteroidota bacterium]|nr:PhzF family phenazine biosynthesis protein [Bacteroidota bacterium]